MHRHRWLDRSPDTTGALPIWMQPETAPTRLYSVPSISTVVTDSDSRTQYRCNVSLESICWEIFEYPSHPRVQSFVIALPLHIIVVKLQTFSGSLSEIKVLDAEEDRSQRWLLLLYDFTNIWLNGLGVVIYTAMLHVLHMIFYTFWTSFLLTNLNVAWYKVFKCFLVRKNLI